MRAMAARSRFDDLKDFLGLEEKKHQWLIDQTQIILKLCRLETVETELARDFPYG